MNKDTLLQRLRSVECKLSPENLACDGEASRGWVRKEGARLRRERSRIVAELGYEPTYQELWVQK